MNKTKVGIVDYGLAGNIHSVINVIKSADGVPEIVTRNKDFSKYKKIIIPGVGTFKDGIGELQKNKFVEEIKNYPGHILGICLGMQLLAKKGFEYGENEGLSLIDAEVKLIKCEDRVPHMGFSKIKILKDCKLLEGIEDEEFYFMHSYEFVNYTDVIALSNYGNHSFVSVVEKDNVFGVQFHPEKSRKAGIKLIKNFINL